MTTPKVDVIIDQPDKAATAANDLIAKRLMAGYEAARVEFCAEGCSSTRIVVAIKWRHDHSPKHKVVSITSDKELWAGDAPGNHPVVSIIGSLFFCGVDVK